MKNSGFYIVFRKKINYNRYIVMYGEQSFQKSDASDLLLMMENEIETHVIQGNVKGEIYEQRENSSSDLWTECF